jgi:OmpA-OmpF porin, OOP family
MRRIDVRTPDAWRAYDFWSGMIALLIPLVLVGLWFGGVTPPLTGCCGTGAVATKAPVVGSPAAPSPAPVALLPPDVEIVSAGGKVTLKGRVGDDATRSALVGHAAKAFGANNVIDSLQVDAGRGSLGWLGAGSKVLADFRDMPAPATIGSAAKVITLSGTVESEADKAARGDRARQLFGEGYTISNGITVKAAAKPATPAVPKIDCATITRGAQINFASGSADLDDDARAVLDAVAPCLTDGTWEVGGHTDNTGSDEVNQALSWRRASAAVDYLREKKLAGLTLKSVGYGRIEPIANNDSDDGRAQNRRLTFKRR